MLGNPPTWGEGPDEGIEHPPEQLQGPTMEKAKPILEMLASQEGVNLAMVVSRDGFIVEAHSARKLPTEQETISAAVSTFWEHAGSLGRELSAEQGCNALVEYKNALVSTTLIESEDLLLCVVADSTTNPATMRYLSTKFSELLARSL